MTWKLACAVMTIAAVLTLGACGGSEPASSVPEPAPISDPAPEQAPALNSLTADEQEAGWQLLFDGASLDAWRGYQMETLPAGWTVGDGAIHFVPPEEGERGDLITREQYANFELSLEWAVSPGGNSGVMFRVSEDGDQSYYSGPEVQILDNEAHRDGVTPETSAGSNYAIHGPASDVTRPIGEFNEARLRVAGDHVTQWLNGHKQVEYTLWDEEWTQLVAASKFAAWPTYGMNESGHIALQDHGNEIWLRNIKVLPLP